MSHKGDSMSEYITQPAREATGAATQPAREANIQAIVDYIAAGAKAGPGKLGIELEQHIVHADDLGPVAYDDAFGSRWILEQYTAPVCESAGQATYTPDGDLIGAVWPTATLTLEPAAQLELSAGPFSRLADASAMLSAFAGQLEALLAPHGLRAIPVGYHPSARATDLHLIPKQRYDFMNHYLSAVSPYGPCMMRGSASTQISIDFADEADCVRKMRLADLCVPLFSLICDNSPIFEGEPAAIHLPRTLIWRHLDPARSGIAAGSAEEGFSWRAYAEWILGVPAIVAPGFAEVDSPHVTARAARAEASPHVSENSGWHYDTRTFGEIYADEPMTQADVEHALSMVFPDVRLKRYLEIRPADSLPAEHAVAFAALVKGLFSEEGALAGMEELFAGLGHADIEEAKTALMADGYEACVYGRPAGELADALFALSRAGLGDEAAYLEPLEELVQARLTPAEVGIVKL